MIKFGITFIFMLVVRIVMGYLAVRFEYMQSWLIWFTLIAAVTGAMFFVSLLAAMIKLIRSGSGRKNKPRGEGEEGNGK